MPITMKEVWDALDSFDSNKVPRLSGFSIYFYEHWWPIIKKGLVIMVSYVHNFLNIENGINSTFLALVPTKVNPSYFDIFLPISLYNVAYKIIIIINLNEN